MDLGQLGRISGTPSHDMDVATCVLSAFISRPTVLLVWNFHAILRGIYRGYTHDNGAVSKVNKKFISHLTRAQRTPSAAATLRVSRALITIL